MKLNHLELKNFRSYQGVDLTFDAPRVLVAGLNGAGKTSIRDAVRWALTGRCDGTDAKGAGADVLIPTGERTADVTVTIDGIGPIARTFSDKGGGSLAVFGWTGASSVQQQGLYHKLQTSPAFLDAVLDTEVFLDLTHIDAKQLVLSLLNVQIPLTVDGVIRTFTLDEIDVKYRQAFEDRKVAKRVLQQTVLPTLPTGQLPTVEAIEGQLSKLRADLGTKRQAIGATLAQRQSLTAASVMGIAPREIEADLSEFITAAETSLKEAEAEAVPVPTVAPAKGDPARATFLRSRQAALDAHQPTLGCVLDGKVQCLTPVRQFQMASVDIGNELQALTPAEASKSAESPLTALRKQLADLQKRQQHRESLIEANQQDDARRERARQELAQLPNTEQQEAEIATLQGRIQKGEELLKNARFHWAATEVYKQAVENVKDAQAEVDRLEALCDQLGPKGARATALSEAMQRFQDAVNPYVRPFGWTIAFSVDPWQAFANKRPVETYSRSERYRIGVAIQLGIAMLSGLSFAIVDEFDMLDAANRKKMSDMLKESPLEQILILGTREAEQLLPKVQGITAYRLTNADGHTTIAERSAA